MNFQPNNGICIPKTKENLRKTIKRKPTAPPGPRPRQAGAGARVPGPNWGCCRLAFSCFSIVFLCFWYAYAIIGLEINIRLDLISNVCINIPASGRCDFVRSLKTSCSPDGHCLNSGSRPRSASELCIFNHPAHT